MLVDGIAPYWMVAMWALFATTLNVSLRWLRPHVGLAALIGAVGGPAAYYAGARLGAIEFTVAGAAMAAIALGWAVLTPLLLRVAARLDGYARP
jgi:cell division protein FtsW (lipid II flippase)